jgi:hypothetical protein
MAQTLTLYDEHGIIYEAMKILPTNALKICFLEALIERPRRASASGSFLKAHYFGNASNVWRDAFV